MKPRKAKQRLPVRALVSLPQYKSWLRALPGASVPKRPHSDLDNARGIVQSVLVMLVGYAVLAFVIATALAGCGGGGGASAGASQKPSANTPADPTAPPPSTTRESGIFKVQSRYCMILPPGVDGVCGIGEADSRWMPAADVEAARIAPVSVPFLDGTYSGQLDGVAMTVSVAGATVTGQSSAGCILNGTWATASAGQVFDFAGSASCAGGVQLTGSIAFVSADGSTSNGVRILLAARGGSSQHVTFAAAGAPAAQPVPTDCSSRAKPANETRFTSCPSGTAGGSFTQSRTYVCSSPPEWSAGPWLPSSPSAAECPPAPPPPPACGAAPPDGLRTVIDACPAPLVGTFEQRHGWQAVAWPQCYEPGAWVPDSAPAEACQLPPDPLFPFPGRWGFSNGEFCDVAGDGQISCTLSYNSSAQLMSGSILPNGTGITRAFKDGVFGPSRQWQFVEFAIDANNIKLTLAFQGAGAPPGSGVLADLRRVQP